jgi:hypothetical protein
MGNRQHECLLKLYSTTTATCFGLDISSHSEAVSTNCIKAKHVAVVVMFNLNKQLCWRFSISDDVSLKYSRKTYTVNLCTLNNVFFYSSTALVVLGNLIVRVSRSHSDTPRSVGWYSFARDGHLRSRWDSNPQSQQASNCRSTPWIAFE